MSFIDKDRPSADWIEQLRRRFPCEREIDRILTRKMQLRAGPGYSPVPLETLCEGAESLIRSHLREPFEISQAKWLSGGASKLQMSFTLAWNPPGTGQVRTPTRTPMVVRMEPAASIVETSRLREFQLIKAFEGVVPVPPVYWVDSEGEHFPYPALIYGFAPGVTKPTRAPTRVSGLGTNFGPGLRPLLAPQFVDHLAGIHTRDFAGAELSAFDVPAPGTQAVDWQLNWWERVWEEDFDEDVPMVRLAAAWMRANRPPVDRLSIVHGDFRNGNFLYTEDDSRITAWLDWELGHIGDRHTDLAWITSSAFGHLHEDGKTFLACGLLPAAALFEAYENASGLPVNMKTLRFYQILNAYKMVVLAIATGLRVARGKTHQDVLVHWIAGIGPMLTDELRTLLEDA
jgi:aminoglycoside phosphotransferase (APT) family kinase protein